jgi:pyruvate,water dikinase
MKRYIHELNSAGRMKHQGQKARSLAFLIKKGFGVPPTYVCNPKAYVEYRSGQDLVLPRLREELAGVLNPGWQYAVRSSPSLGDCGQFSLAGRFRTHLNVNSVEGIVAAIVDVWDSVDTDNVREHLNTVGASGDDVKMGIIIQKMVDVQYSGMASTRNPMSGLDETVVELVPGVGDSLPEHGITPQRWIYKWGDWVERPGDTNNMPLVERIVREAKIIEKEHGRAVDLEWAYDGENLYWLKAREMSTVVGANLYSDSISKEFLPGIIKPLVWSVNIPIVNTSWKNLLVEIVGNEATNISIDSLAKQFHYRAYFNMGVIGDVLESIGMPRESIEMMMGIKPAGGERPSFRPTPRVVRHLPRMLAFALKKLWFARRVNRFLDEQKPFYDELWSSHMDRFDEKEALVRVERLFEKTTAASYYVIVSQLLMGLNHQVLKRLLATTGVDIADLDFSEEHDLLRDIDLNHHLAALHQQYLLLDRGMAAEDIDRSKADFVSRFGHLSESGNDFSSVQWREQPDYVARLIADYGGPEARKKQLRIEEINASLFKRLLIRSFYRNTLKWRVNRERVNFLYVYGYSCFRPYFLRIAGIFVDKGYIQEQQDIFYLRFDEIRQVVGGQMSPLELNNVCQRRKADVMASQDVELPGLIVGDERPTVGTAKPASDRLSGVGVSKGRVEGVVRVVRCIQDFDGMQEGEIIVIPYSDISWTPFLCKAGAIISESGGMLSHCSIIAREYGVPAVVSVNGALKLQNGTRVIVDGYRGKVEIAS